MKIFWTILKYLGILAGSVATLYGAFMLLDDIRDDVTDVKEDMVEVKTATDSILVISKGNEERSEQNELAIRQNAAQDRLVVNSYLDHLKKDSSLTKSEFIEYMEPFLEYIKKNSIQTEYGLTPLVQTRPTDEENQISSSSR